MTSRPIDISTTLEASGGDDEATESAAVRSDDAAFQFEVGGATTDLDVHFEARLSTDYPWRDYLRQSDGGWLGYSNGEGIVPTIVDLGAIEEIRVRIVNQDGSNQADVDAEVVTG